ncbi:hypothetical protein UFOVP142_40 [uncultured Caudovirales phage]|uniref:Uncharacterized protein n=1 Tax=uncultured Caudovirales phage TaxID=2100421 RepID=A0A6J7XKP7_9CAUD|nr:hypothetical protein UFOVP142_40 [uncultured Caudovirales phage]
MNTENWMSEVERQLRDLKDAVDSTPTTSDAALYTPYQPQGMFSEWIWIRLTGKATAANGEKLYSWDQMIHVFDVNTDKWLKGNLSGTYDDVPALGLNNEDLTVNDGVRYPARWNPATGQWIFFLRKRGTQPTPWPQNPTCMLTLLNSYSINFPGSQGDPVCGQTAFSALATSCFGDWPILEAKLWITWAGTEKLIAWDRHESCSPGLTTVSGYQPFGSGNIYNFPTPDATHPASWRYEITLASSVKAFYTFTPPMKLYSNSSPCTELSPGPSLLGPDATVSGTNLTGGGTLSSCYSLNKPVGSIVTVSAQPGTPYSAGSLSGFRVTITDCHFVGPDPTNSPGWNYDGSGIAEAVADIAAQFQGETTIIGPQATMDLCSGNPPKNSPTGTAKTFKVGGTTYSFIRQSGSFSGVSPGTLVNPPDSCNCNPSNTYLPTMPMLSPHWHGSSITWDYWRNVSPSGAADNVHINVAASIEMYSSQALADCQVHSGWSTQVTGTVLWGADKFNGSTVVAHGGSIVAYTILIEYLG